MAHAIPAGYRLQLHDEVPSTNTLAMEALQDGDPGRLWVVAKRQAAGRGRRGRAWSTENGNLASSLALRDLARPDKAATVSFSVSLALHQAVIDLAGPAVTERLALKWPNDVLLDGRKIAGILIEGSHLAGGSFGVVIGVGVNCVSHPGIEGPPPSDSLNGRGLPLAAEDVFTALARNLDAELTRWDGGNGFKDVRAAWVARSTGLGDTIIVRLSDRTVSGVFDDIDDEGQLVVRHDDGHREIFAAGDIFFPGLN